MLPGHSGSGFRDRPVPPASPTSKPCSSCESVHADLSCPMPAADSLLGLCLSRAFSFHASDPRTRPDHEDLNMPLRPRAQDATQGTLQPLAPGETVPNTEALGTTSSAVSSPLRDWPAPPLGGAPTPMALELRASPSPLTFEALQYAESGVSPKRSPSLLRFLASSTPS